MREVFSKPWFKYLRKPQQELVRLSVLLYERERRSTVVLSDYSFVIFPMSKAYEGFLKQYLYDCELIDERTYHSRRFRIGRAINPDVRENQRDEYWLYDDLVHMCGKPLAQQLWQTWLTCRNRVFHYFPNRKLLFSFEIATEYVQLITETMQDAHTCQLELEVPAKKEPSAQSKQSGKSSR
ncbi:MAG: hypothetical protein WDZ94_02955 [Patescibacteria group bacterium]